MRKALLVLLALAVAGALAFYLLTMPAPIPASALPAHAPDLASGRKAIAAYIKSLPPLPDAVPKSKKEKVKPKGM